MVITQSWSYAMLGRLTAITGFVCQYFAFLFYILYLHQSLTPRWDPWR